jgi:uncharacterized membrane protein
MTMTGSELAPIAFGLISATCWGAADFSGGLATKRTNVYSVIIASQLVGVSLLIGLALIFAEQMPAFDHLVWGAVAGVAGGAGLVALYRALATGRMGTAASVSAVVTAAVPVIFGLLLQGLPRTLQLIGFGLALIGVWFVSRSDGSIIRLDELKLPFAAGIGFGVFLLIINRVSERGVFWPLVAARFGSLSLIVSYAASRQQLQLPARDRLPLIALVGVLDALGNAFYALAGQVGRLDVAAVLSSLYPASTVWLAGVILKERLSRLQTIGIASTLAAIVLITL